MDVRVLRYFLEVAKSGNITKAADKLHITQPTLSRQIRDLEEEIGASLFIRGNREVSLTDAGYMYHQRVLEIINLIDKAQKDLIDDDIQLTGLISIGCVESYVSQFLAHKISSFSTSHPLVQYDLYNGYSDDIKQRIDLGMLDFGIMIEPVEAAKYDCIRLPIEETWGVLMPSGDDLAKNSCIRVEELDGLPLILSNRDIVKNEVLSWLDTDRTNLNIIATTNLLTNMALLVKQNLGYMITIEGAIEIRPMDSLSFVPFEPERKSYHVLVWKKNKKFNKSVEVFIDHLRTKQESSHTI